MIWALLINGGKSCEDVSRVTTSPCPRQRGQHLQRGRGGEWVLAKKREVERVIGDELES